jgi:hypothetical protein
VQQASNLDLYRWVLILHSDWRWVVLLAGLYTLVNALAGLSGERPWATHGAKAARFFGIALDIQVLMGAALFLLLSPLTTVVLSSAGMRLPRGSQAFFFVAIHPAVMFAAFIAVHISSVLVRRARNDAAHHRRALIFYGITWLAVLAAVPWGLRPWLRF